MWLSPPATFCHSPFHITQSAQRLLKSIFAFISPRFQLVLIPKPLSGSKVEPLPPLSVVLWAALWAVMSLCGRDECLGLFLSLLIPWQTKWPVQWCSQDEWLASVFPWQPPAYCSNPPPGSLICLLLILSLSFFPCSSFSSSLWPSFSVSLLDLSALAKKIKLEAMASYNSNQQHGGPNGENGDHNPGLGESWPHSFYMCVTCWITLPTSLMPCQYDLCCLCVAAELNRLKPGCEFTFMFQTNYSSSDSVLQRELELDIWVR